MGSTDVNIAYDNFIKTFVNLYDKHCPVKKICSNVNGNKIKPWFTTGLRNACKKKNNLYRKFLQCRTKSAEERYKVYKNKLTTILRNSEKIYYSTLLDKEKNNIKGTWKILNTIIRKGQHSSPLPDKFMSNGKTVTHKKDIANGFNDFFVNVGPNLAKDINIPNENTHVLDYLKSQNPESMFLASVEESEVINIVRNCKNKKSTGYDGIDMTIIKQVIYHIIKPFFIIIRQPLCPVVGRRPQHAVSKLPCLVLSSAISCRSSICPGRLSIAWLVSLVVFSCHMVSNW